MNDDRDPIIDACLAEILSAESPPDLTRQILLAWRERGPVGVEAQGPPRVAVTPCVSPKPWGERAANRVEPVEFARTAVRGTTRAAAADSRRWIWAVVASVGLVIIGASSVLLFSGRSEPIPVASPGTGGVPDAPRAAQSAKSTLPAMASDSKATISPDRSSRPKASVHSVRPSDFAKKGTELDVPFAMDSTGTVRENDRPPGARPVRLPSAETVAQVNRLLTKAWKEHQVTRVEMASDAEWCRRVYLRLVGRIPMVEELNRFTQSTDANKRADLIRDLLETPEYADAWSRRWTSILIGRSGGMTEGDLADRVGLQEFLEDSLTANKPFNRIAYELLTAAGSNQRGAEDYNGAVNFLLAGWNSKATLATSRTARIFLGRQLGCIQCHDHPFNEAWTQNGFWELNAFFRQIRVESKLETSGARLSDVDFAGEGKGSDGELYYEKRNGELKVAFPVYPDGQPGPRSGKTDEANRRQALAEFIMHSPDLSQATVNRIWSQFLGYGFTPTADDFGPHASVSHPELLELLAGQFAAHDYDLKQLMTWITLSDAFGASSKITSGNATDVPERGETPLFARYYARELQPEEVFESLQLIAKGAREPTAVSARVEWLGQFSRSMATDEGDETDHSRGDIRQSLTLMNSPMMQNATSIDHDGILRHVVKSQMPHAEKVEHLFLAALARKPTTRELKAVADLFQSQPEQQALQDLWWALLNSNEFLLDH